ncbi:MAG: redox-sensing transcriptional repressor Rex, partial [Oscillospiraceae bacterium]|nr:redox-sensing transcriptional repressor Rex [Oscillospiraceae bacterium]
KVRQKQGILQISATRVAEDLRLNPVQVRKDLALASAAGRPKTGYPLDTLVHDLEHYLGYRNARDAFVLGAGLLGQALMAYTPFADYGLSVLAAFDPDAEALGADAAGKKIFPLEKLPDLARRMQVKIGILTVPPEMAQQVADFAAQSGIRALWNFTAAPLRAPEGVIVQNEDMALSLSQLSNRLTALLAQENKPLSEGSHAREYHHREV